MLVIRFLYATTRFFFLSLLICIEKVFQMVISMMQNENDKERADRTQRNKKMGFHFYQVSIQLIHYTHIHTSMTKVKKHSFLSWTESIILLIAFICMMTILIIRNTPIRSYSNELSFDYTFWSSCSQWMLIHLINGIGILQIYLPQ